MNQRKPSKDHQPLYEPFDITLTINVSGITKSDGEKTLTPRMIIDQITEPLVKHQFSGLIRDWEIKVEVNNINEAKATLAKSKKNY